MCSFTVLGGGGSENQSLYGVTTIYHLLRIELIRLLIVACGMLVQSSSMAVLSCGYWQELEHAVVYANPEHPKHAQWRTHCLPSALYSENQDSSMKRTPLQSARRHWMWAFAHSSWLRWRTAVRPRSRWVWWACRLASLRQFLTVCAEIIWLCKPIVAAAFRVAGLRRSWRWRWCMWRSWASVVTRGLQLWGRFDVLPNSLKRLWRRLIVEKLTLNSRATALVKFLQSACQLHAPSKLLRHLWHYIQRCISIHYNVVEKFISVIQLKLWNLCIK